MGALPFETAMIPRRMQRAKLIEEFDQFLLAQQMAFLERTKKKIKQDQITMEDIKLVN